MRGYLSDCTISSEIPQDLTDRIIGEINQGGILINYAGHGSKRYWVHEGIFYTDDIPNLSNDQRLPVMVLMTGLNGYPVIPNFLFSSQEVLLAYGAGAVAAAGVITLIRSVPTMIASFQIGARQLHSRLAEGESETAVEAAPRTALDLPLELGTRPADH